MPILLPYPSDMPLLWFEEPPKVVPEDVLVLGIAPPPDPAATDAPPGEPTPVVVATMPAGPVLPAASVAPDAAPDITPVAPTGVAADPEPVDPPAVPEAAPAEAPAVAREPAAALPLPPVFEVPPEDAFPTLAELDAILAANAGPPPEPGAAERAEVIALLGLDPAIADDPVRYAEALANLPQPDADQVLEQWMQDYDVGALPPEVPDPAEDWQIG